MRAEPFQRRHRLNNVFSWVTTVRASALLSTLTRNDFGIDSFINIRKGSRSERAIGMETLVSNDTRPDDSLSILWLPGTPTGYFHRLIERCE